MSENIYKEAFKYAMEELHKQYISQERESEFIFNFNVNYVEDTIDTITVSVASLFMKTQVTTKGSLKIIENKLKEITGIDNLKLECIIKNENLYKPEESDNSEIENQTVLNKKKNDEAKKIYDNFFDLNAYNQVRVLFSHVLVHIDVPIFYFISGYYL